VRVAIAALALVALAVTACGLDSVSKLPSQPELEPIGIVGDLGGVNQVTDAQGNARYLGEIVNRGDTVACAINLAIDGFDANGTLISNPGNPQFWFGDVLGETFRFSAFDPTNETRDNCISPGKRASFDIRTDVLAARVVSFAVRPSCQGALYPGCIVGDQPGDQPFVPPPAELAIDGAISEGTAVDGRVVYTGVIRNTSPLGSGRAPAYHVKIVMTAMDAQGLVVEMASATMDVPACAVPTGTQAACLASGETWSFSVPTTIFPSATCPGCFSFQINQKMKP
jgi:hypothetical protein